MRINHRIVFCSVVVLSFVTGLAVARAANCRTVGTPCPGWGAGSTQAQQTGFCCVAQTNASVPCSAGQIASVTAGTTGCGSLRAVQGGNCGTTDAGPCAVFQGNAGCTSVNCPNS